MYPILFHLGPIPVYSYGFMIALGAISGVAYLAVRGRKELGLSFDQANTLFLYIFIAAFIGGKLFLLLEDFNDYIDHPQALFSGSGFVFYGSFLLAIPVMLVFFKRNQLPTMQMLDIMGITTCLVHIFGRVGCFMAGCCYGHPTHGILGIVFTDPACPARPLDTPLHPTQLYEAAWIGMVLLSLLYIRERKTFHGQLFLLYLMAYALGRIGIEFFRGDEERGYFFNGALSNAQAVGIGIMLFAAPLYLKGHLGKLGE